MRTWFRTLIVVLAAPLFSCVMCAQTVGPKRSNSAATPPVDKTFPIHADGWGRPVADTSTNKNRALAPKHDLSGFGGRPMAGATASRRLVRKLILQTVSMFCL